MRDLDELLDPTVSRRASTAARTPDFAVVERRGRQRRRRTRAMGVGAVAAVVAAVSVVGTQVASDRSDTAPAEVIEYEGPDGELARAIEAGEARGVTVATIGAEGTALTVWRRVDSDGGGLPKVQHGFGFAADGETLWSPFEKPVGVNAYSQFAVSPLPDGSFVISRTAWLRESPPLLADRDGLRALEVHKGPADLSGGNYDGFALGVGRTSNGLVYAVDRETSSLAPVAELAGIHPVQVGHFRGLASTPDGGAWVVPWRGSNLVRLDSEGTVTRYPYPGVPLGPVVGDDGRAAVLSLEDDRSLVTIVEDGRASSHELRMAGRTLGDALGAVVLPDGRLLVHADETMLRSTDASWRRLEDIGVVAGLRPETLETFALQSADGKACLVPTQADPGDPTVIPATLCTVDGETWEPLDLTP